MILQSAVAQLPHRLHPLLTWPDQPLVIGWMSVEAVEQPTNVVNGPEE